MQGILSASPADQSASRATQRRLAFAGGVVAFWALLALLDIPKPQWDDVWYSDAAINIAHGGGLESPVLQPILDAFGTRQYFLTAPFHAYVLGGWLRVFGVSSMSILLFSSTCGAVGSLGLAALLEHLALPVAGIVLSVLFYALNVTGYGFRTEMLGYAMCFVGLALATRDDARGRIAGIVLAAGGALTAPNLTGAMPVLLLGVLAMRERRDGWRPFVRETLLGGALAAGICVPLFLLAIQGHLHDFLLQTNAMKKLTSLSGPGSFLYFKNYMYWRGWGIDTAAAVQHSGSLEGPIWCAFFPAYAFSLTRRGRAAIAPRLAMYGHAIAVALPVTLLYRHVSFELLSPFVFAWLAGVAFTLRAPPVARYVGLGLLSAVLLVSNAHRLAVTFLIAPPPSAAEVDRLRAQALGSGKRLAIDEISARYVFGFAYPRDSISYRSLNRSPVPNEIAPIAGLPPKGTRPDPGDLWIVSQANLCRFAGGGPPCPSVRFAGHEMKGTYEDPAALIIVE
jgi:hypothetical protein